jgi:HSP20 family protein
MAKQESTVRMTSERLLVAPLLSAQEAPSTPLLDLYEVPDGLVVTVDLPGIVLHELKIVVSQNNLTIEGSRTRSDAGKGCYLRVERTSTAFHRAVHLPIPIKPHAAMARYERGVLTVTFPKIPDRRQKAIEIPVQEG